MDHVVFRHSWIQVPYKANGFSLQPLLGLLHPRYFLSLRLLSLFVSLLPLASSVADRHPSRNTTGNNWHPCLWSQVTAPPAGWVGKVTGKKNSYPAPVTCLPHCDHGQRRRVLTWPVPPSHTMGTKKGTCFFKEDVVMGEGQSQLHQRSQMPRWPWEVQVQDQFQPPQVSVTVILRLPEGREHTDLQLWSDIDQRE